MGLGRGEGQEDELLSFVVLSFFISLLLNIIDTVFICFGMVSAPTWWFGQEECRIGR